MRACLCFLLLVACREKHSPEARSTDQLGIDAPVTVVKSAGGFAEYREVLDLVQRTPGVVAAAPFAYSSCTVPARDGSVMIVLVKGVDPVRVGQVLGLEKAMVHGQVSTLALDSQPPAILLGASLARHLRAKVDDDVTLVNAESSRSATFRVGGVFYINTDGWDNDLAIAAFPVVQQMNGAGDVARGVEMAVDDVASVDRIAKTLEQQLGSGYTAITYKSLKQRHKP